MNPPTEPERVNFFPGKLLSASDFQAEQEYHLERRRRHNRYLHGWGVVSGLTIATASPTEIVVEPGFAIDCAGNEILVCTQARLPVRRDSGTQFVVIQYLEIKASPTALASEAAKLSTNKPADGRIRETLRLEIVGADPSPDHRGEGTGTPGCGFPHLVCLARLSRSARNWKVELQGRRRA